VQDRSERRRKTGKTKNGEICAASDVLEPATPVGNPPTGEADRDGGEQRPPERQEQIGRHTQDNEGRPKDLFLHALILTVRSNVCRWALTSIAKEPPERNFVGEASSHSRYDGSSERRLISDNSRLILD
jgi:hypothetical protein